MCDTQEEDQIIKKLNAIQKELFSFWRYDVPTNHQQPLTPEQSLEAMQTVLSAMNVLRYCGHDSDVLFKYMHGFYHDMFEQHPLRQIDPGAY
jgi:hypothetical protein